MPLCFTNHLFDFDHFFSGSKNTEVTITREGDFTISPTDFMEEINIFKGTNFVLCFFLYHSPTIMYIVCLSIIK